ncbi:MAG: hypothetical protein FWC47_04575 [Oscillospiraceae bacterium]|nr:hypothetical protein [Oscillospiraceae bacterium]
MILVLSDQYDVHADVVCDKLKKLNVDNYRFNLDVTSLKKSKITYYNNEWILENESGILKSSDIHTVWCRRSFVELLLEEEFAMNTGFQIWRREWNAHLNGLYTYLKDKKWLNPLRKAYKGENKYYQMSCAKNVGFFLPDYVVSNNRSVLEQFINEHDGSVIKFMNQDIFRNEEGKFCASYVNEITLDALTEFGKEENPVFVQQKIPKDFEVRYTVVGDKHFVCRIDSQNSAIAKDDWRRYDLPHTPHIVMLPPTDIRSKVELFMFQLQIPFGALDFIVTPKGEWYFLEINCMGQWLWIEELTGLAISDSIVQWLVNNNKQEGLQ